MQSKTFTVPNIGCSGCVRTVESEVGKLPGVTYVEANEQTKVVNVEWDAPASWEQIEAKLNEIDYAPALA